MADPGEERMSRIVQAAIFLIIALTVYLGMHLYVFFRLGGMLGWQRSPLLLAVPIGLAVFLPVSAVIERTYPTIIARSLYTAAVTWLGVLWLLFSALLIFEVAQLLFRFDARLAGWSLITVVAILTVVGLVNASIVRLNSIDVPMKGLTKDMRVVHLSDIHLGTVHNSGYLQKIVQKTNALAPDLVLITGDMVDGSGALTEHSYASLSGLSAPVYFTTGNHERYIGVENVSVLLEKVGVHVLRNRVVTIKGIQIIGIDDADDFSRGNKVLSTMKFHRDKPSILMYHRPEGLKDASAAGIGLQLSGHTHNGQIVPFNFLVALFNSYVNGLHRVGDTFLYVSPGSGTWGPPMRLGTVSEITLIRLRA